MESEVGSQGGEAVNINSYHLEQQSCLVQPKNA